MEQKRQIHVMNGFSGAFSLGITMGDCPFLWHVRRTAYHNVGSGMTAGCLSRKRNASDVKWANDTFKTTWSVQKDKRMAFGFMSKRNLCDMSDRHTNHCKSRSTFKRTV